MALQNGLALEHVHSGHAGAAPVQRGDQCIGLHQLGTRGVHEQRGGLHARQVLERDDAARFVVQAQVHRDHVALREEFFARGGSLVAIGQGLGARCLAAPDAHVHAEGPAIAGHELADAAIAPDTQRLAAQHRAQPEVGGHGGRLQSRLLPSAVLEVGDVLRQSARGRHHQGPGQLCRRHRRAYAFCHGNAALGTGGHVDVIADLAGLGDELKARQLFNQLAGDLGALAHQHDDVGILEPDRQLAQALDGVGVDLGGVGVEPGGAMELAHCILVVVEDHDVHPDIVPWSAAVFASQGPSGARHLQRCVNAGHPAAPICAERGHRPAPALRATGTRGLARQVPALPAMPRQWSSSVLQCLAGGHAVQLRADIGHAARDHESPSIGARGGCP